MGGLGLRSYVRFGRGYYIVPAQELFTKRYSLKTSLEKEHEVSIPFDYLSKQEMEEERNMDPNLAPEK